jgi:hypothetical protein
MKRRKLLLSVLSFLTIMFIFPFASCAEKEPTTQADLQTLLKESADEMQTTKSISTSNTGSFNVEIPQIAEQMGVKEGKIAGQLNMTTAQNINEKQSEMKMDASVDMGGSVSMKINVEFWNVDGWYYFHFNIPFAGDKWGKTNKTPEGMEKFTDSAKDFINLLLDNLQLDYLGKEDIGGETNYHVKIKPTKESLKNIVAWIAKNSDSSTEDVTKVLENETFNTVMIKLIDGLNLEIWIDKSTKLISQVKVTLDVEFTPEELEMKDVQSDSGNIKLSLDVALNLKAQKETISISPPAEALNAKEIDPEDFGSMFNQ